MFVLVFYPRGNFQQIFWNLKRKLIMVSFCDLSKKELSRDNGNQGKNWSKEIFFLMANASKLFFDIAVLYFNTYKHKCNSSNHKIFKANATYHYCKHWFDCQYVNLGM